MYATGRGVTRDVPRALGYYQSAIKDPTAIEHMTL
jgi:TPR repeat protein